MGRSKFSALIGAALFFLPTAGALAADIPEIPPPDRFAGNWYLRGHIGMAAQHFGGLDHPSFATAPGFAWLDSGHFAAVPIFGVGIGWRHSEHLRFDLTGEYRGKSDFSALDTFLNTGVVNTNSYTGKKSELTVLANAYWDLGTWHNVTPYIGAGIGASYNSIYDFTDINVIAGGGGFAPTGHKLSLAWAVHAGASMQVTENLALELGYSFTHLGDAQTGPFQNFDPVANPCPGGTGTTACVPMNFRGIYSHDLKLGLRWALGGSTNSYYPPVVKY